MTDKEIIKKFEYIQDFMLDLQDVLESLEDSHKNLDGETVSCLIYPIRKQVGICKEMFENYLKENKENKNEE